MNVIEQAQSNREEENQKMAVNQVHYNPTKDVRPLVEHFP
jgi:hypothetical protein